MKYLLDTHALIWALHDPAKLSKKVRVLLESQGNEIYFSSISFLEMSVKISARKLDLILEDLLRESKTIGFLESSFLSINSLVMSNLPPIHADPFDRALIAQALGSGCSLVSKDKNIQLYEVPWVW